MKKTFVTYGDDNYRESLERIGREARATGVFDSVRLYTPADLPEPFASYTRDYPRGGSSSSLVQAARISMLIQLQVSLFQKIRVPTGRQRNLIQIKPICQNRISQ